MEFYFPPSNFYSQDAPKTSPWQWILTAEYFDAVWIAFWKEKMALVGTVYRKY